MKPHCFICDKSLDKEHWSHTVKAVKTELEEPDANYEFCDVCSAKVSTFIVRAKYSSDKYKL